MKKSFISNSKFYHFTFLLLFLVGCNNTPKANSFDLKIIGQYDVVFYDDQKTELRHNTNKFNKSFIGNAEESKIEKHQFSKKKVDYYQFTLEETGPPKDTVRHVIQIKSTTVLDTVSSKSTQGLIDYLVKGYSDYEVVVIANKTDTIKHTVSSTFDFKMEGTVKGEVNDIVIGNLIQKYFLDDYSKAMVKAIKDEKLIYTNKTR